MIDPAKRPTTINDIMKRVRTEIEICLCFSPDSGIKRMVKYFDFKDRIILVYRAKHIYYPLQIFIGKIVYYNSSAIF